jgi:hypothetical protein
VLVAALLFAVTAPAPAAATTVDTVVEWNGYATTSLIDRASPDADIAGANIGKHVAHWRDKHYFQPMDGKH